LFKKIEGIRKKQLKDEEAEAKQKFREQIRKEAVTTEEEILGALLNYPEFYGDVRDLLTEDCFSGEFYKKVFANLSADFNMAALNEAFTAEELGRITKMMMSETAKILNRADRLKNHINLFKQKSFNGGGSNINNVSDINNIKAIAHSGTDEDMNAFFDRVRNVRGIRNIRNEKKGEN